MMYICTDEKSKMPDVFRRRKDKRAWVQGETLTDAGKHGKTDEGAGLFYTGDYESNEIQVAAKRN